MHMKKKKVLTTFILLIIFFLALLLINKDYLFEKFQNTINYLQLSSDRQELYNKLEITEVLIKERKTGTAPFSSASASDLEGNDITANDNIVRTLDKVEYTLELEINANNEDNSNLDTSSLKGGVIKVKAKLPNQDNDVNMTWEQDAWMQNVSFNEDKTEITAEFHGSDDTSMFNSVQSLSFTIQIGGYKNEITSEMLPEFEVWMEGNAPDNTSSTASSIKIKDTLTPFSISGTAKYNIAIYGGEYLFKEGTETINGETQNGKYRNFGIGIALQHDTTMPDFRGIEYPKGEFNVRLKLEYRYVDEEGNLNSITSSTTDAINIINGTKIYEYGVNGEIKDTYNPATLNVAGVRKLPFGNSTLGDSKYSVTDSGTMTATQTGEYIDVSFKNFKINNVFPEYGFSNIYKVADNVGYFASGNFELFMPYYSTSYETYYMYVTVESATYKNTSGTTNTIDTIENSIADENTSDNNLYLRFSNGLEGQSSVWQRSLDDDSNVLDSTYEKGDGSVIIGDTFQIGSYLMVTDGDYLGGTDGIIMWDSSMVNLTQSTNGYWMLIGTRNSIFDYKPGIENLRLWFGVYNNSPDIGLTTVEEMNLATYDDFTWYSSYTTAAENGVVTAMYYNDPDYYGNNAVRSYYLRFTMKNDDSIVGKTAIFRYKVKYYGDVERTESYYAGGYTRYFAEDTYVPTIYDGEGNIVSTENEESYGETVLATTNISSLTVTSTKNNIATQVFDIQDVNIDFEITPSLTSIDIHAERVIPKTTITTTLPAGLNYVEGSANKEPLTITINEDGSTTLVWSYENWQIGQPAPDIETIKFKTEISSSTINNTTYRIESVIYNSEDERDTKTFRTYTNDVLISNLSGSQISKISDKKIIEVGEDILVTNTIGNSGQTEMLNVRTTEILPKSDDGKGSIVNGKYTIEVKSLASGQKIYYSTKNISELNLTITNGKYSSQNVNLSSSDWTEVSVGDTIPYTATAIITQIDSVNSLSTSQYEYIIHTEDISGGDILTLEMTMSSDSTAHVIKNNSLEISVINRIISGNVIAGNDTTTIPENIKVLLLNSNDEVVKTTTISDNKYSFDSIQPGNYYIQFEIPANYEVSNILSNVVDYSGKSSLITTHNSSDTKLEIKAENIDMVIIHKEATLTINHYVIDSTTSLSATETSTVYWGNQYTTSPATVDSNYELVSTPSNAAGTVNGDITVNYYYQLKTATITVHHYIEGTTTKLADDVITTQNYTTSYTTQSAIVDSNYELVATPSNANGTVSGNIIVTYYYKLKTATITVNYYIEGTTTKLSDTLTKTMNWGETYTTNSASDISENYELVSTPTNATGTVNGDVTINYYYKLKEGTLTTHFYVKGTTTKLSNSITKIVNWGDKYTTSPASDINENYELVSTPNNATGTISANETVVIYYYQLKTATLTVNYYIEGTTTKLSDTLTKTMNWGETYTTSLASDISENYELVSTPTNSTGTIKGDVTVNYYYRLKEAKVTVNYYIEGTTTKLADSIIQELNWGDEYTTTPSDDVSNNYELVSTPSNATGTIKDDAIVVNYYYRLKEAKLTVHHYIEGTTDKLADSEVSTIYWGDTYQTLKSSEVSTNYELVSTPTNATGTVSGDITVIYYYRLKTATITVYHYIEGTTTRLSDSISFTKKYTEQYSTNAATDIDPNYELSSLPNNASGIVDGNTTVIYYYKLKTAILTVHHYIEGTTTSLIADEISTVTYTNSYKTSPSSNVSTNYELASTKGTLQGTVSGDIEVTYYYKLKNSTLIVKHLEYGTNKELAPQETKTLKYTDEYETSESASVPGNYEYYSKTENYKGIVATDNIEVIYYYQVKDSKLSSSVNLKVTEEITSKTEKVDYKLEYTSTINDYRGSGTITIIVQLPYHIDEEKSDLNNGTYNSDLKTITWITTEEDINATSEQKVISSTKNFSVTFSDIVSTDRTMNTSVTSNIKLDNNEKNAENNQITYIKIQGKIIVHYYIEGTTTKIADDVETSHLVGETYISKPIEKNGYILKKAPDNNNHIYQDEIQEVIYQYERIKFNIITKVDGGEGTIGGDEIVFYGENSTEGSIVIKPNEGYQVSHIIVNGEEKNIEQCKNGCVLNNFMDVQEDKEIVVIFEVIPDNPETSSIITTFTTVGLTILLAGSFILMKKYKPSTRKI